MWVTRNVNKRTIRRCKTNNKKKEKKEGNKGAKVGVAGRSVDRSLARGPRAQCRWWGEEK